MRSARQESRCATGEGSGGHDAMSRAVCERVQRHAKSHLFPVNSASAPDDVRLDPNAWALMDATLVSKK